MRNQNQMIDINHEVCKLNNKVYDLKERIDTLSNKFYATMAVLIIFLVIQAILNG